MTGNGVNIKLFLQRLSAGPMDIAYIIRKVHAIGGYLPMKWVEYGHEEVPMFMDKYSIHGCSRSMGTMQHICFSRQYFQLAENDFGGILNASRWMRRRSVVVRSEWTGSKLAASSQ